MAGRSLPNRLRIARYWTLEDEWTTFPKLTFEGVGCFACGYDSCALTRAFHTTKRKLTTDQEWMRSKLERCHLIAAECGGSSKVENIVLLCKECHRGAPMVGASAQPMVDWINRREPYINVFWNRLTTELAALNPRFAEDIGALGLTHPEFFERFRAMLDVLKGGYHPGGDAVATVAAIIDSTVRYERAVKRRAQSPQH